MRPYVITKRVRRKPSVKVWYIALMFKILAPPLNNTSLSERNSQFVLLHSEFKLLKNRYEDRRINGSIN